MGFTGLDAGLEGAGGRVSPATARLVGSGNIGPPKENLSCFDAKALGQLEFALVSRRNPTRRGKNQKEARKGGEGMA